MSNKHHRINPTRRKSSWLTGACCAALASLVSLLGFSSCASSRKAKQAEAQGSTPTVTPRTGPDRPRLLYGPPPVQYRQNVPAQPETK